MIRAQDFAKKLAPGTKFLLIASDPGVYHDIPVWCRMHGHEVVRTKESSDCVIHLWIQTAKMSK